MNVTPSGTPWLKTSDTGHTALVHSWRQCPFRGPVHSILNRWPTHEFPSASGHSTWCLAYAQCTGTQFDVRGGEMDLILTTKAQNIVDTLQGKYPVAGKYIPVVKSTNSYTFNV